MEGNPDCPQFDSYLGGHQSVPKSVSASDFIKNRMEEVVMLTETIKESPFRGQTFQRLPKHMRRRQMSHYIKRLPRKLQRPYLLSLKDGMPVPSKCPSRKYRRRPGNLLVEYNRRQREHVWLETHVWHAKRFHMIKKWGYKLPERPTSKSFRACYRALSEHCLLTDISYYNCIELKGPENRLLEGLKQCTSPECGLTFGAKMYLNGTREGSLALFHPNSYPYRMIGNVTFMWNSTSVSSIGDESRRIWIWVHPLMHEETVECFKTLFDLRPLDKIPNETEESLNREEELEIGKKSKTKRKQRKKTKKSTKRTEQIKLAPKNVPFIRTPKYANKDESVFMILLKDTLNRFQMTGPLSQAIISQTFDVISVTPSEENQSEVKVLEIKTKKRKLDDVEIVHEVNKKAKTMSGEKPQMEVVEENNWWQQYYKDISCRKNWENQKNFYRKLSNCAKPTDVASGIILSLVVGDPRLKIPSKREKAVPRIDEPYQMSSTSIDPGLCQSPIWNPEIRDQVSAQKLTTQEINEARAKKIVPGSDVTDVIPNEKQSRIPILLVQRPGRGDSQFGKLGLGSGWDIIAPAGFGMPIWLPLIFRGARTGGLRESELLQLECNNLNGYLQPDSVAGETESQTKCQHLRNLYFKLPPNKRPNFIKLGVLSPFYCAWKVLIKDWILKVQPETEKLEIENQKFSVLRDRKILRELNEIVTNFGKFQQKVDLGDLLGSARMNCLVPVVIECAGKGNPKDLALLCLPEREDFNSKENKSGPVEIPHLDENEKLRKILKLEHSKVLKSLRRKRRKDRSKMKEDFANNLPNKVKWKDILKSDSAPSETCSKEYNSKMESLWLTKPEAIDNIMNSCSRKVLGFVVKGDFCFSKSVGVALGYVTLPGLVELMKLCKENKSKLIILVRNKNHVQYRIGMLRISMTS